ncbi:MAG: DMT family transporter [Sulfobacillus sp.]
MSQRMSNVLLASLAPILWGGMYVASKFLMESINPLALVFARIIIALGFYIAMEQRTRRNGDVVPWKIRIKAIIVGSLGFGASTGLQFEGTFLTSAHIAALITAASPLFVVMFAWLILKEKTRAIVLTMLGTAVGCMAIAGNVWGTTRGFRPLGLLLLFMAALSWGLYSVLILPIMARHNPWTVMKYGAFGGLLVLAPFSGPQFINNVARLVEPTPLGLLIYMGVGSTGLAYVFWTAGIRNLGASTVALLYFLQPLVAALLGWALLGERLDGAYLIGGLGVLISVVLGMVLQNRQPRMDPRTLPKNHREDMAP